MFQLLQGLKQGYHHRHRIECLVLALLLVCRSVLYRLVGASHLLELIKSLKIIQ